MVPKRFSRFAWTGLNSDGLFVGILAIYAGCFDLLDPNYIELAQKVGYQPPTYFVYNGLYIIGGCLMLLGFFRQHIGPEVLGRFTVWLGAIVESVRVTTAYGLASSQATERYVLFTMITLFFGLRIWVLLNPKGIAVVLPGKDSFTDAHEDES